MVAPADQDGWDPRVVALAEAVDVADPVVLDRAWEPVRRRLRSHLRRDTTDGDPRRFVADMVSIAQGAGLLRRLVVDLVANDLLPADAADRVFALTGATAFNLQVFANGDFRPTNALLSARRFLDSCERVCRIDVGGEHRGTGVLVRPTLVATAAHVVDELVEVRDGVVRALPGSHERLSLTFGYAEDYLPVPEGDPPRGAAGLRPVPDDAERTAVFEGRRAEPHASWLAWCSPPLDFERDDREDIRRITGITELDGPWDTALIRLAEPLHPERRTRLRDEPQSSAFPIHVLHHPQGGSGTLQPLLWSIGRLDEQLGAPAVRYLHDANTLPGSSGAPVFDDEWRVVALHQAGGRTLQRATDARQVASAARNRAVPVCRWSRRLTVLENSVVPYLREISGPSGVQPVVGRRGTQERLWRALQEDALAEDRLLIVRGEPGTGLRFTKRLVSAYVRDHSDGVVVALDVANALATDAAGFAGSIAGTLSAELRPACGTTVTTRQSEVRNGIAPSLAAVLDGVGGSRAVWLVFEGFDQARVSDQHGIDNLLLSLIGALPAYRTVRLVMVSWQQTPPDRYALSVEDLKPPTVEDVACSIAEPGAEPTPDQLLVARLALKQARDEGLTGYPAAVRGLEWVGEAAEDEEPPP